LFIGAGRNTKNVYFDLFLKGPHNRLLEAIVWRTFHFSAVWLPQKFITGVFFPKHLTDIDLTVDSLGSFLDTVIIDLQIPNPFFGGKIVLLDAKH